MKVFSLTNRPDDLKLYKKTGSMWLSWQSEPFQVETDEGLKTYDENSQGWEGGYYVAYPEKFDSEPYGIPLGFAKKNYIEASEEETRLAKEALA